MIADIQRTIELTLRLYERYLTEIKAVGVSKGGDRQALRKVKMNFEYDLDATLRRDVDAMGENLMSRFERPPGERLLAAMAQYGDSAYQELTLKVGNRLSQDIASVINALHRLELTKAMGITAFVDMQFKHIDRMGRGIEATRFFELEITRFLVDVHNTMALSAAVASGATSVTLSSTGSSWSGRELSLSESISQRDQWERYGSITLIDEHTK